MISNASLYDLMATCGVDELNRYFQWRVMRVLFPRIVHFSGFLVHLIGLVDGETDVAFCD